MGFKKGIGHLGPIPLEHVSSWDYRTDGLRSRQLRYTNIFASLVLPSVRSAPSQVHVLLIQYVLLGIFLMRSKRSMSQSLMKSLLLQIVVVDLFLECRYIGIRDGQALRAEECHEAGFLAFDDVVVVFDSLDEGLLDQGLQLGSERLPERFVDRRPYGADLVVGQGDRFGHFVKLAFFVAVSGLSCPSTVPVARAVYSSENATGVGFAPAPCPA